MSIALWLEDHYEDEAILRLTYNLGAMWKAAGVDFVRWPGKPSWLCAGALAAALHRLVADPHRFKAMNPPNGWGDYRDLLTEGTSFLDSLRRHPSTRVAGSI